MLELRGVGIAARGLLSERMARSSHKLTLVAPPTCAVLGGFLLRRERSTAAEVLATAQQQTRAASPRFEVDALVALPAGEDTWAVGVALAKAPLVYSDYAKVHPGMVLGKQWDFVPARASLFGDLESSRRDPGVVRSAVLRAEATLAPLPEPLFGAESDECDGFLAGDGALYWGCLLPSDGATYEEGRVHTARSRYDDNVVRLVGIEVARATAASPVRLGAAVESAWQEEAAAELVAVLDKPAGWWLLASR